MQVDISEGIRSVLVVEDEGLVAMMMEDLLRELGISEIHICADLESALNAATTVDIDCAVLDHHIRGGDAGEVADILAARGIPFMFTTGSGIDAIDERHRDRPLISKPFSDDDFKLMLVDTFAGAGDLSTARALTADGPRVATAYSTD